jgi:hypothetical protein
MAPIFPKLWSKPLIGLVSRGSLGTAAAKLGSLIQWGFPQICPPLTPVGHPTFIVWSQPLPTSPLRKRGVAKLFVLSVLRVDIDLSNALMSGDRFYRMRRRTLLCHLRCRRFAPVNALQKPRRRRRNDLRSDQCKTVSRFASSVELISKTLMSSCGD